LNCTINAVLTCLVGRGEAENARLSLVADADTAFEHSSVTDGNGTQVHMRHTQM